MSATGSETKPGGIGQKAQAAARTAADTIKTRAAEATTRVKDSASGMIDERRGEVADRIGGMGHALEETAHSVEAQDPNIAWLTEQASSRLQRAAEYVRSCSWEQLRGDSADLARRHPIAFFGGMFALGAAAGALIKAGTASVASTEDQFTPGAPPPSDSTISPGTEEPYAAPTEPYAAPTASI